VHISHVLTPSHGLQAPPHVTTRTGERRLTLDRLRNIGTTIP